MSTGSFIKAFLFMFIALSPIQDFFLQGTPLRGLGASPSLFPLLAIAILTFCHWLMSGNLTLDRALLTCLAYIFLITVYGFILFGFTSHQESLIWKSITSFISLGLVIFAVSAMDYRMHSVIRAGIYTAFGLVVMGFCFSAANPFGLPALLDIPLLHFTSLSEYSPRGFASEPSEFSICAIVFGLLSAHLTRSKTARVAVFALTLSLLIASRSKGGILTLFLCVLVVCLVQWHSRWYHVAGVLFVLLPLGLFVVFGLIPVLFPEELVASTGTVPTRFSMILCALISAVHHPFGVGLSGFLPSVADYLPAAMSTLQSFFPFPLNFEEVAQYQTSADMVSTKTFYFDQLIRFGIPFGVMFFVFVGKLVHELIARRQVIIFIAVLASTIAITTYIAGTRGFEIPILFGVALNEVKSGSNPYSGE